MVPILLAVIGADQWTPIHCFPEGYDDPPLVRAAGEALFVDELEQLDQWRVLRGGQNAAAQVRIVNDDTRSGAAALAVQYQFEGSKDYEYVALARTFTIPEPGLGLVLWVKGNGTPLSLRVRISDRSGETFQFDVASLAFTGWRQLGALLRSPAGHWGGNNDVKIDYPCAFDSLVIDCPSRGYVGTGTILLDRLALVREAKPQPAPFSVETLGRHIGNIYEPGEEIVIRVVPLRISGTDSQDKTSGVSPRNPDKLQWEIVDYWDKTLASDSVPVGAEPVRLSWRSQQLGWFRWKLQALAGEEKLGEQEFRFAVLPPLDQMRPRGVSERVQAQMLVKTYVLCLAAGCAEKVFWYDFKDDGLTCEDNESNFGIVHHQQFNCAPKPAYVALATLSRVLRGATFEDAMNLPEGAVGFAFKRRDGRPVAVMWALSGEVPVAPGDEVTLTDIMGNERRVTARLAVTVEPVYVAVGR